ncbi:MAG: putative quinol monooxygenase [Gammaproteobacteria bacterium]
MNKEYFTVVCFLEAKPGKENELEEMLMSLIEPSLGEEGCVNYNLYKSHEDPTVFMFYENWLSKEALERHKQSAHIKIWHSKKSELLAIPDKTTFWEKIS